MLSFVNQDFPSRVQRSQQTALYPKSATVVLQPGESIDHALKRFKAGVEREGIFFEERRRRSALPPSAARRAKSALARKRRDK